MRTETTGLELGNRYSTDTTWKKMGIPESELEVARTQSGEQPQETDIVYRVYKRRWFGLGVLALLNIVISWGWLTFAPVSNSTKIWFDLASETPVNWLSTLVLFTFVVVSPAVIYILNRYGFRHAILLASFLTLSGFWIRYAGTKTKSFPTVVFGQVLIGIAQPFILSVPTYYSDLWFTSQGRISATALVSLSNPFGAAVGQLVNPMIATGPDKIPEMVLWVTVIATVACIPALFVQARPPTPPCASAATQKLRFKEGLRLVLRNKNFLITLVLFSVYLGFFSAMSSLLNQIMMPYAYTADEAGITGAVLIVAGLVVSAILCPIVDRTQASLLAIKVQVPIIAVSYIALIFAVTAGGSLVLPIVVAGCLGAASFSLLPLALEWMVEITHPAPPEIPSTILWSTGQLVGGVFILVMDVMKDNQDEGKMKRSLIFEGVVAAAVAPLVFLLVKGKGVGRLAIDKPASEASSVGSSTALM